MIASRSQQSCFSMFYPMLILTGADKEINYELNQYTELTMALVSVKFYSILSQCLLCSSLSCLHYQTFWCSVCVIPIIFHQALRLRFVWSEVFFGLTSAFTPKYCSQQIEKKNNTGIKSAKKKYTNRLQKLYYYWETKVKQCLLATDEIVVLHVTHSSTQPDKVVMKQRPSWLQYVSLKNKTPSAQLQLQADVL